MRKSAFIAPVKVWGASMDQISLLGIIDALDAIAERLYNEEIDQVAAAYELGKVIDNLKGWLPFLPKGV